MILVARDQQNGVFVAKESVVMVLVRMIFFGLCRQLQRNRQRGE
jgi:hypothetical protein